MAGLRDVARENRSFLAKELQIDSWQVIEQYYATLQKEEIADIDTIKNWLIKRSELVAAVEEEKAWRYINTSRYTDKKEYSEAYIVFSQDIEPKIIKAEKALDKKLIESIDKIDIPVDFQVFIRGIKKQLELYREENIALLSDIDIEEQKYSAITGKMSVQFKGQELTLQQADNLLKATDRKTRKQVFDLIHERRGVDYDELNRLLDNLIRKRQNVAKNAGYINYLQYRFDDLGRFDYSINDCMQFHSSVKSAVVPLVENLANNRRLELNLDRLLPFDLKVDTKGRDSLKPARTSRELIDKSLACLYEVDETFGNCLKQLDDNGYLDLESRKCKAPGGYNYPLFESNVPFIFMNASNSLRDVVTLMHESGHAIHSILSGNLPIVYQKEFPSEIAELASMSMELISMEHWHHFFTDEEELKRAKKEQIEGLIQVLPWVATIDKFQHWIYTHECTAASDRMEAWEKISGEYESSLVDWYGFEMHHRNFWQKQIHLFQFPLYYIEYGIAQLGAIGVWKNYKENPQKTIEQYKNALSLGYTKTLPELYEAAGVPFDFSEGHIKELMSFVKEELAKLD